MHVIGIYECVQGVCTGDSLTQYCAQIAELYLFTCTGDSLTKVDKYSDTQR